MFEMKIRAGGPDCDSFLLVPLVEMIAREMRMDCKQLISTRRNWKLSHLGKVFFEDSVTVQLCETRGSAVQPPAFSMP